MTAARYITTAFIFFILSGIASIAQVTFSESYKTNVIVEGIPDRPRLSIRVTDSLSSEAIQGAYVFLSDGDDTLKTATGQIGTIVTDNTFIKDTLHLKVTHIGYRTVDFVHYISKPLVEIEVKMQEDPMQINSIIVTGDAVAMVIKGDTTIYNAAAFTTMKGDRLRELIRQLPGIKIDGDRIFAQGREISRIMVNGTTLFNRNVAAALDMIKSDEVTRIKLYDQHDPDRLIEQDTLRRKEKVLDVATKNPKATAQDGMLGISAGGYSDRGIDGKAELLGGVRASYRRFEVGKPQLTVFAEGDSNVLPNLAGTTRKPQDAVIGDILFGQAIPRKLRYNNVLRFNYDRKENETRTEDTYLPTDSYNNRTVESSAWSDNRLMTTTYSGNIATAIGKSSLTFTLNGIYSDSRMNSSDYRKTLLDGTGMMTDVASSALSRSGSIITRGDFRHFFEKKGREISASIAYDGRFGGGDGLRIDTLSTSFSRQWIVTNSGSRSHRPSLTVSFSEPLGKGMYLSLTYIGSADFSDNKRFATDRLTGLRDTVNTYDYTNRVLTNTAGASFRYRKSGLTFNAGLSYRNSLQTRVESFPGTFRYPVLFHHLSPWLILEYSAPLFNMDFSYSESTATPSIEQLRGVIDDASPMFLTAGNPDLKQTVSRQAAFKASIVDIVTAMTWHLNLRYEERTNYIANKTVFFDQDTELTQYGYTALAGSQLSTPVNVDDCRNLSASLSFAVKTNKPDATIWPSLSYNYGRTPWFVGETLHGNETHDLRLTMSWTSSFSQYARMDFMYSGGIGRALSDKEKLYDSMSHELSLLMKFNFLKRMWLSLHAGYLYSMTTSGYKISSIPTTASISCKFGKNDSMEIGLSCEDIINRNRNSSVSVSDEYVRYLYDKIFGRSICLRFVYNF